MKFSFVLPEGQVFSNPGRQAVAISPDGKLVVYTSNARLYLKSLSEFEAKPIQGTETLLAVVNPVFSPDGRSIAFYASSDQTLKRIAVSGGSAVTICPATIPYGMGWGPDG